MTTETTTETAADTRPPPQIDEAEPTDVTPTHPGLRADLVAVAVYIAGALWVTARLWTGLGRVYLAANPDDQIYGEWMVGNGAHAVAHLANPLHTVLLNAPDGVNLMGNAAFLLPGLLLTPLTLLAGAHVTFSAILTANLAATGIAWYFVLSRHLVRHRVAAFLGGAFCAFAPGIVAQTGGSHAHITGQYLVPVILWRVAALREPGRAVRNGLILGLLVTAQVFIGEEILFMTALAGAVMAVGYAVSRLTHLRRLDLRSARDSDRLGAVRREVRPFLTGLAVAGAVAVPLTAYPLWMQFFGPGHYHGLPPAFSADLAAYPAYARESVGGDPTIAGRLAANPTEENEFFGWPLLVLVAFIGYWLRGVLAARLAVLVGVVAGLLSLGDRISWQHHALGPGPYRLLSRLPLFDSMITTRLGLVVALAIGVLLALAADRVLEAGSVVAGLPVRLLATGAVVAALLPVAPTRLQTVDRPPLPEFITSGHWHGYVGAGRTLVPVPMVGTMGMRWAIAGRHDFAVAQGYFLGPTSADDPSGRFFASPRPTQVLLEDAAQSRPHGIGAAERDQARADVRYWRADAIVLPGDQPRVRPVLDQLFGPGARVDDVWVWDVRALSR
jgi:hypothetical protein